MRTIASNFFDNLRNVLKGAPFILGAILALFVPNMTIAGGTQDTVTSTIATCSACHGGKMQGLESFGAPRLAGQSPAYIERQLVKFREGSRGTAANDFNGQMMRGVAASLPKDISLAELSRMVTAFRPKVSRSEVDGDPVAGKRSYQKCAQCHGDQGQGREDQHAPKLAGMSDWYLLAQIKAFRTKLRGVDPRDADGEVMSAALLKAGDGNDIRNILAYLATLQK